MMRNVWRRVAVLPSVELAVMISPITYHHSWCIHPSISLVTHTGSYAPARRRAGFMGTACATPRDHVLHLATHKLLTMATARGRSQVPEPWMARQIYKVARGTLTEILPSCSPPVMARSMERAPWRVRMRAHCYPKVIAPHCCRDRHVTYDCFTWHRARHPAGVGCLGSSRRRSFRCSTLPSLTPQHAQRLRRA
jgi:hypothetical protein